MNRKQKVLFLDRDGTILVEPPVTRQIDSLEKVQFVPGVISALARIADSGLFKLVLVTNQDGLGTSSFPEESFRPAQNLMLSVLSGEGITFSDICIDRSFPEENAPTRKPETGMLSKYLTDDYDLAASFVIGDRVCDIQLAQNLGARGISRQLDGVEGAVFSSSNWKEIADYVLKAARTVELARRTRETNIALRLGPYGGGSSQISTGLGFFDHMLEQLASHSGCSLFLKAEGDLRVDEHHTVEDVGIVLGEAFRKCLGNKKGIRRYGFLLPMDESIAQVALDFSGRSFLDWKVDFRRERIGDVPTELFSHFFQSFVGGAACTLHVACRGQNEHHKIEAVFKAVGRAIRQASECAGDGTEMPSTKGML